VGTKGNKEPNVPWDIKKGDHEKIDYSKGRSKLSRQGFYTTKSWILLRNAYRNKFPLCFECLKEGVVTPMEVVDHIKPADKFPELKLEWDNLQSLCNYHHQRKTAIDTAIAQGKKVRHLDQSVMDDLES